MTLSVYNKVNMYKYDKGFTLIVEPIFYNINTCEPISVR